MSIILDALKKSESDQQRQSGPALFEVRVAPPKARFPVWAIAIVALLVINMLIVGYLLLRHPSHSDDTAAANAPGMAPAGNGAQLASRAAFNSGPGYGQVNSFGANGLQPNNGYGSNGSMGQNGGYNGPAGQSGNPNWQAGPGADTNWQPGRGGSTNMPAGQGWGNNGAAGPQGGSPDWQTAQGGGNGPAGQGGGNGATGQGGGRNWPGAQGGPNWQGAQGGAAGGPGAMGANGEPTLANRAREAVNQESGPSGNPDDYAPATDADSSLFKGHVKRGTESGVPLYQDMAVVPGANLPELRLDLHVYAAKPQDRFALINMRKMHEGDSLPDNVKVESITPEGVVLSHNGSKFLLPRD